MNDLINTIRQDNIAQKSFSLSFVVIFLTLIYILIYYQNLPPFLPLFNQFPWGDKRLSITIGIFIPPIIALSILVLNLFFSSFIYKKTPLLSRILAVTSFLITILTFLFIIRTIQIVL